MAKGKDKIIEWATKLFSSTAYENVAVSGICKAAKVSNGLFYKYFKDKEELFKYLLEETSSRINIYFEKVKGDSIEERLESFIKINLELTRKELPLIKVYREGQYKFIEYEKEMRAVYMNALKKVFERKISDYEYLFIMSGIRYINVSFTTRDISLDYKFFTKIILNGFFENEPLDFNKFEEINLYLRVWFDNENLKTKLLMEGEKLFGDKGIYETKVQDISNSANIGVGSFYQYFKTKEEFLGEIGKGIKNTLISFLSDNSNELIRSSPLEKHLFFLYLMLKYYKKSSYKYQIIRELEFIEPDIYKEFITSLEYIYLNTLKDTKYSENERFIISNTLLGIAHYMGIEFFFLKNLEDKKKFLKAMGEFMVVGINY